MLERLEFTFENHDNPTNRKQNSNSVEVPFHPPLGWDPDAEQTSLGLENGSNSPSLAVGRGQWRRGGQRATQDDPDPCAVPQRWARVPGVVRGGACRGQGRPGVGAVRGQAPHVLCANYVGTDRRHVQRDAAAAAPVPARRRAVQAVEWAHLVLRGTGQAAPRHHEARGERAAGRGDPPVEAHHRATEGQGTYTGTRTPHNAL
jgi:hypothetical protein